RGDAVAADHRVQVELQFVQFVQAGLDRTRYDLYGPRETGRRRDQQRDLLRGEREFLRKEGDDVVGRQLAGLQYTDRDRRRLAAGQMVEEFLLAVKRPHRPGAHGEILADADLPAGVLR